jgi:hypothetical protein
MGLEPKHIFEIIRAGGWIAALGAIGGAIYGYTQTSSAMIKPAFCAVDSCSKVLDGGKLVADIAIVLGCSVVGALVGFVLASFLVSVGLVSKKNARYEGL